MYFTFKALIKESIFVLFFEIREVNNATANRYIMFQLYIK